MYFLKKLLYQTQTYSLYSSINKFHDTRKDIHDSTGIFFSGVRN